MFEETMKRYNDIVDLVESCTTDLLDCNFENKDYDSAFAYYNQRLSYFALEVISKFSHS